MIIMISLEKKIISIPEHDALSLSSTYPASHPQVNDPSVLVHTWWQILGPVHSSISSPV